VGPADLRTVDADGEPPGEGLCLLVVRLTSTVAAELADSGVAAAHDKHAVCVYDGRCEPDRVPRCVGLR
jgi:hypothetical protein